MRSGKQTGTNYYSIFATNIKRAKKYLFKVAAAAPEPAYQAPVSQGNLYYYYYPVQVFALILPPLHLCLSKYALLLLLLCSGFRFSFPPCTLCSLSKSDQMTFQAEPIVEKSDDELDPLVLVLLPITILVGILALISVISKFIAIIAITILSNVHIDARSL